MIYFKDYLSHQPTPSQITQSLQKAIDEAAAKGGDTVFVHAGQWMIQTFFIKTGVELHLSAGATLIADPDLKNYPEMNLAYNPDGLGEHYNKDRQKYHLIVMEHIHHASITGQGTIDGNGMSFWTPPKPGGWFYREKSERISPLIEIAHCQNIILSGITIKNSPGWTVHPRMSDQIRIEGVVIENHLFGPNTDGIDIDGCRYVFISNCRLHCGDDAIIIKAMKDARSTEHVVVTNCIIETNCGALALGAETHHDIKNVVFTNCTIINSHRMLAIIMWQQGTVENVIFSNITGTCMSPYGIDRPIHIDIQEHHKEDPKLGHMRNIQFSNIQCRSKGRVIMTAQDGATIENVTLRDIQIDYPDLEDPTEACRNPGSSQMSNGSPEARIQKSVIIADNIKNLVIENVRAQWPKIPSENVPMHGIWTRNCTGRVRCHDLTASNESTETFKFNNSTINIE